MIYRAYDSRPWPISRSHLIYGAEDAVFADGGRLVEDTIEVYSESDKEHQEPHPKAYRLFDFKGKIKVIAVPFIEGCHQPQNKMQMLSVARLLKKYHANGVVHGDIRLLNIVFAEPPENSTLIDWDFGGKKYKNVVYPRGYQKSLTVGRRRGEAGKPITAKDDVYALYHAFTMVIQRAGNEWNDLVKSSDVTLDRLIEVLKTLVENDDCDGFQGDVLLVELLDKNTKLGLRSDKHQTGEGDPVTPEKANLVR
jgi:hypothetical protein